MDWIYSSSDPLLQTLAGAALMFIAVIIITRIIGLRSFAKFTTFDFAFTVAVGSIVSSTLTSSTSIAQGGTAIAGLLVLTALVAWVQRKSKWVDQMVSNEPLLLMDGKNILQENLAAARVSEDQLIAKLREANVIRFEQVKAVVLETTGDISVLHNQGDEKIDLESRLLQGVRRSG